MGPNFDTDKSIKSLLKSENSFPAYSEIIFSIELFCNEANIEIKFSASGLCFKSSLVEGSG